MEHLKAIRVTPARAEISARRPSYLMVGIHVLILAGTLVGQESKGRGHLLAVLTQHLPGTLIDNKNAETCIRVFACVFLRFVAATSWKTNYVSLLVMLRWTCTKPVWGSLHKELLDDRNTQAWV